MNNEVKADKYLVAYCGLYCGACGKYLKGKCPGCRQNEKAKWCKIRACCIDNRYHNCSECQMNPHDCKKFNNLLSKFFALVFGSDREACIKRISEVGADKFADEMAEKNTMTIKKR